MEKQFDEIWKTRMSLINYEIAKSMRVVMENVVI